VNFRIAFGLFLTTLGVVGVSFPVFAHIRSQDPPLTPTTLKAALDANPMGDDAAKLAERVRAMFGKAALLRGSNAKTEGLTVAVAIEAPGAKEPPKVVLEDGQALALQRLGATDVYVLAGNAKEGDAGRFTYQVDGKTIGGGQFEVYSVNPDSVEQAGVPKGMVTQMPDWKSKIFDGTERKWWIYVPAQYKPENPACVMVFQDGGGYKNFVPTVFDNLIAKGDMPVTVGVFVDPGTFPAEKRSNRSFEYDTLSDQYARFMTEEILPEVEKTVKLRHDPESRAIAGASSGGICSFTVAWEKPDQFGRVMSWIGSFTGIASGKTLKEGGNNYPVMIRKTPRKPFRVFLQDGDHDLDNEHGNWPLANQEMMKALAFKGYDYKFVFGHGGHSYNHGRAILPDALRWLWRDYKPQ
jgi:enterochelin esterase-like enzyme